MACVTLTHESYVGWPGKSLPVIACLHDAKHPIDSTHEQRLDETKDICIV